MATLAEYKALTAEMVRLAEITRTDKYTVINRCTDVGRSVLADGGTAVLAGQAMFSVLVRDGFATEDMWISAADQAARKAAELAEIEAMCDRSAADVLAGEQAEQARMAAATPIDPAAVLAAQAVALIGTCDTLADLTDMGRRILVDQEFGPIDWTNAAALDLCAALEARKHQIEAATETAAQAAFTARQEAARALALVEQAERDADRAYLVQAAMVEHLTAIGAPEAVMVQARSQRRAAIVHANILADLAVSQERRLDALHGTRAAR